LKAASATPGAVAGNDVVLAQKNLEADRNQMLALQQSAEAARQALGAITQMEGYLRVTAPFDGVITERNVHPGTLVGPASGPAASVPLVRLVETRRLRLVVPVPESYIGGVTNGMPITFSVAEFPGRMMTGKVARIAEVVDPKTRTMPVEIDVANADGKLASGSFCQVRWPVRRSGPSLLVPSRSVASTTGRTFVVRIKDGKVEWVDVKTGLTMGVLIEVFGDLHAGDMVATRGTDELRQGTEVRATLAKQG
jgi:RND family efflux transporter MFP subunit